MDYSKYQKSRDLSWQILHKYNIAELPVKVSSICRSMGYPVVDYEKGNDLIERLDLHGRQGNNDGFTFKGIIFYNNSCSNARKRFTVAHELGHCLLHGGKGLYNREPSPNDNPIEQEANVFASRLLAPACVLWGMNVTTPEQIADICNISLTSAKFRMERLKVLCARNKFLTSPLERIVYEQFKDYILSNKL